MTHSHLIIERSALWRPDFLIIMKQMAEEHELKEVCLLENYPDTGHCASAERLGANVGQTGWYSHTLIAEPCQNLAKAELAIWVFDQRIAVHEALKEDIRIKCSVN